MRPSPSMMNPHMSDIYDDDAQYGNFAYGDVGDGGWCPSWCEPICKRPPTAAKTRGQLVDRDADAAAARDGRVREASSEGAPRKRVRFSDEVAVIGFSQPCHDDDDDGGA